MSIGVPPSSEGLDRLRAIFDAYGGDPRRWPDAERDVALTMLARSADARRLHEEAMRLDEALDLLPAAAPSPGLEDRIVAAALLDGGAGRQPAQVRPITDARRARRAGGRLRTGLLAAALPMAAAAALALWLGNGRSVGTPAAPANVASTEIKLADLGSYEVPGDELLAVSVLDDAYDAEPLNGCSDGELGCLRVETLPLEPLSRDDKPVKEVRFLS